MTECYEVVSAREGTVTMLLAICYTHEEAELVRAALERSKQFVGAVLMVRSLGRFRITKE